MYEKYRRFTFGFGSLLPAVPAGLGAITGLRGLREYGTNILETKSNRLTSDLENRGIDSENVSFIDELFTGAGSFIPLLAVGAVTAVATPLVAPTAGSAALATSITAGLLESLAETGSTAYSLESAGYSNSQINNRSRGVFGANVATNIILNRVGVLGDLGGRFGLNAKAASELTKLPQRKLAVVLKNVLKNAGSEGVQEYLQNVYSEIALDTPLEDALSSSLRSGAVGAVLGGFAGGGLASIKRRVDKVDEDGIEQASEYFDPNDVANVINPQKGSAQERGLEIIKGNLSINDVGGSAAKDIEVATAIDLGKEQLTVILNRDTSTDAQKKRVRSTFDFLDQIRDYAPIYEYINTTKPTGDSLGEYNSSTASTVDYNTFTQEDVNGLLVRNSEAIRGRIENINNANKFEIAGVESNIELVQQEINKNTGTLEQDLLGNETTGLIKQTIDTINQTRVPNKQVLADSVRNFKTLNEFRDFSKELASLNDLYTRTNSLRRLSFFSRNFVDRNFRDIVGNNNLTAQEKLNQSRKTLLDSINDFQGVDNFSGAASRLTDKINSVESIVEIPEIISDLENSLESSITRDLKMDLLEKTENLVDSFDQPLVNKDGTDSQIGVIKRYFNLTSQEQSDLIIKRKASKNFNTREKVINSQLDLFGGNYYQDGDVKRFNNNKTLEDFLTQYHTLRYLRTTGTLPGEYSVSRSLNNIKKIAANIVQVATGGYGIQSQNSNLNESDDLPLNIRQRITKNLAKININQNSLDDVLSNIGRYLKVEEGGNYVANFGNIRNSEEEYLRINSLLVQKVANTIDTHYDGDFLSQFDGKLDELNVAQKKLYGKNKQFALKQDVYLAQELESDTGVRGGGTKLKLRKKPMDYSLCFCGKVQDIRRLLTNSLVQE